MDCILCGMSPVIVSSHHNGLDMTVTSKLDTKQKNVHPCIHHNSSIKSWHSTERSRPSSWTIVPSRLPLIRWKGRTSADWHIRTPVRLSPFSLVNWPSRTSYVHWRYSVFLFFFAFFFFLLQLLYIVLFLVRITISTYVWVSQYVLQ
jgi:hypothetical protein